MATYTVSTSNAVWARSLLALNANAEAHENEETDTLFDLDFIDAIRFSLAMWLEGEIDLVDEDFMRFANSLRVFADRIENRKNTKEVL